MTADTDGRPEASSPVLPLIGNTPLVPLRFEPEGVTLFAKCEFLNPIGSIKDRFAQAAAEGGGVLVDALDLL